MFDTVLLDLQSGSFSLDLLHHTCQQVNVLLLETTFIFAGHQEKIAGQKLLHYIIIHKIMTVLNVHFYGSFMLLIFHLL